MLREKFQSLIQSRRFWGLALQVLVAFTYHHLRLGSPEAWMIVMGLGFWVLGDSLRPARTALKISRREIRQALNIE